MLAGGYHTQGRNRAESSLGGVKIYPISGILSHVLRMQVTEDLKHDGFAIVDNVFGDALSQTLLDEIKVSSDTWAKRCFLLMSL